MTEPHAGAVANAARHGDTLYLPALDGVRCLAVTAVFLNHMPRLPVADAGPVIAIMHALHSAGWAGVDLFLCLSAYLFTFLLRREFDRFGRIDLRLFFMRRILRIYPLYFLMLFVGFFALPGLGFGRNNYGAAVEQHLVPFLLFFGNVSYAVFPQSLAGSWAHLWTINMEEHFYFVIPFLAPLLYRARLGVILRGCVAVLLLTATLRLYVLIAPLPPDLLWTFTLCRLDPFIAGVALGIALPAVVDKSNLAIVAAIVAATVGLLLAFPTPAGGDFVWTYPVVALGAAGMLVLALRSRRAGAVFSLRPLRWTGRISYGIYVYHMVVILAVRELLGEPASIVAWAMYLTLAAGGTLALAALSYRYFERPFLILKARRSRIVSRPA